jgi:hypothetical protein
LAATLVSIAHPAFTSGLSAAGTEAAAGTEEAERTSAVAGVVAAATADIDKRDDTGRARRDLTRLKGTWVCSGPLPEHERARSR